MKKVEESVVRSAHAHILILSLSHTGTEFIKTEEIIFIIIPLLAAEMI